MENTALALGAFDGLHKGHIKVISETLDKNGLIPSVLTFKENPTVALQGKSSYIISHEEKLNILNQLGVKNVFDLDFNEIKNMTPDEFFYDVIIKKCHAKHLFCGENFHFGIKASGDVNTLKKLADKNDIKLTVVPFCTIDDNIVSSTKIRQAIADGDMIKVKHYLGRYFSYKFTVVQGNKIGRTLGTPTINQALPQGFAMPKFGVYASAVTVNDKKLCGVTNIGVKPTIGNYQPLSETWIPNFEKDMYGMVIRVELLEFIRPEQKFNNLQELKDEIFNNAKQAQKIFNEFYY